MLVTPPGSTSVGKVDVGVLAGRMSLHQQIGQMTQVELGSITPDEVATWSIGSVFSGGGGNPGDGSAGAWRESVDGFVAGSRRSRLGIPILYGTDAVHGHSNVIGATIFPHNLGMGATADPELVRAVTRAGALETVATGVRWSFAPCLAVPQDIRWGRTYEGFSADPELVGVLGSAAIDGWHGDDLAATGVVACAKHFVGEGAMVWGTAGDHRHPWMDWWDGWGSGWQLDQGDIQIDEDELRRVHLAPFVAAIRAGALTVMACYGSWHGRRLHAHHRLLTQVLKGELGFEGFVVSDWLAVDQLDADYGTAVALAINSGVDMVMVPFDHHRFVTTAVELVESGRVARERIDDAVRRILRVKAAAGLLAEPTDDQVSIDVVGCDEHRALARAAVRASAVVLVDRGALPIPPAGPILAAGEALDDIGIACGGWTISWEGSPGPITPGSTVLDGLRRLTESDAVRYDPDGDFGTEDAAFGIVSIHELPYVEGAGDRADLSVPPDQLDLVRRVRERVGRLVVVVISGRPLLIEPIVELADAVVACWLPGSEADGIAEVLLGAAPFTGRLPTAWPRSRAEISGEPEDRWDVAAWPLGHHTSIALAAAGRGDGT